MRNLNFPSYAICFYKKLDLLNMFTKSDVALWWKEPVFTGKYCEPGHNHAFTTGFMGTYITCCANLLGVVSVSVAFKHLNTYIPLF